MYLIPIACLVVTTTLVKSQSCAMNRGETWCGCGQGKQTLGPCIGGDCPDGYTCVCDYCCEGCFDDCYDCALFAQYCDNTHYCELREKCKRTCGLCVDAAVANNG